MATLPFVTVTTPISPLPFIFPVRDTLIISFQDPDHPASDNLEPTELEAQLQVENIYGSGIWITVAEFLNPYTADDTASIVINRALVGVLKASPPNLNTAGLQLLPGIVKRYRIRARDLIGGLPTGDFTTTDPANAWLAGQSYSSMGDDNLYSRRAFVFLSSQGDNRTFHPNQDLYIEFLTLIAAESIDIQIEAYYTDSTQESFIIPIGGLAAFQKYGLNIPKPAFTKEVKYCSLALSGFLDASATNMSIYFSKTSNYERHLYYLNSLGGYEGIVFTGKTEEFDTTSSDLIEGVLFPAAQSQSGNFQTINQSMFESFTLRSGFLSLRQRNAIKDMTLRNEVYLKIGNNLRKIILSPATFPTRKDGEFLYSIEISARLAYDHTAYNRA